MKAVMVAVPTNGNPTLPYCAYVICMCSRLFYEVLHSRNEYL